jgi:hypothetical protein
MLPLLASAAEPGTGAGAAGDEKSLIDNALGLFGGRFLPDGIYGARDVYPYWGVRYSRKMFSLNPEFAATSINAGNVNFYTASASLAFPSEIASFAYFPFFGVDVNYFSGHTVSRKLNYVTSLGFHVGVSPIVEITSTLSLRVDLKLNFNPGNFLNVGAGLMASF